MSFLGFNIAGSALQTFQEAENVTAQNIANVQTPGASRQIVNIGQLPPIDGATFIPNQLNPGTQGTGVFVQSITRIHQDSYDALFRGATASQNFYSTQQQVLQGVQSSLGEPNNGINAAYTAFQTALQTLVNNPSGSAERTGVLNSAQGLVRTLNTAGSALQAAQVSVQGQAKTMVTSINNTLDQIAALNGQIRAATAVGNSPNTFEDQRDQLIDQLSTYMSTSTSIQADGSTLVTVNGHALVNDTVVYHMAAPVIGTTATGQSQLVIGFQNDPNPTNPTPIQVGGGQLGGLIDVYNNKITPYIQQLNDFASGLASESDRLSQAGYDATGQAGGQLFAPVVAQLPVSAGNIQVGIATGSEFPAALASTASGTLVRPMNLGNSNVDTTALVNGNVTLANAPPGAAGAPPAAQGGVSGTLTIAVDGITQNFDYSTAPAGSTTTSAAAIGATTINVANGNSFLAGQQVVVGSGADQEIMTVASATATSVTFTAGLTKAHAASETVGGNASTIGGFINAFNAGHFGVTASFDQTSQKIVFTRDPTNIDLVHRAAMQAAGGTTTPSFTLGDLTSATTQPAPGAPAAGLLDMLGSDAINGVNQNASNALGTTGGGNANALLSLFSLNLGAPALQTAVTIPAAGYAAGSVQTITGAAGPPPAFATLNVGDVLTIYDGQPPSLANQQNVTVTAVNRTNNTITFQLAGGYLGAPANTLYITSAQTQTLQGSYTKLVAKMGLDTATAITGSSTQTTLTANVNQVRQSVDGINIDEETQNLVKFQNAYGAAAHMVAVISQMLSDAINLGSGTAF